MAVNDLLELEIWNSSPVYDEADEIDKMQEKYDIDLYQDDRVDIINKIFGDWEENKKWKNQQ